MLHFFTSWKPKVSDVFIWQLTWLNIDLKLVNQCVKNLSKEFHLFCIFLYLIQMRENTEQETRSIIYFLHGSCFLNTSVLTTHFCTNTNTQTHTHTRGNIYIYIYMNKYINTKTASAGGDSKSTSHKKGCDWWKRWQKVTRLGGVVIKKMMSLSQFVLCSFLLQIIFFFSCISWASDNVTVSSNESRTRGCYHWTND